MNLKSLLHPLMQHYFLQKAAKVYCFALLLLQRFKKNTYSPLEKNMKHWCTKHKRNVYNYSSIYKKCFVIIMQYINFNTTNISILANRKRKNQKKSTYYYISTQQFDDRKKSVNVLFFESAFFMFSAPVSLFLFYPIFSNFNSHPFYLFDPIVQKSIRHNRTSHCVPT